MDREETFNLELNNEDTKKFKVSFGETTYVGETGGAVDSVNGMTGDVILTTSDLENTSDYQTGTEVAEAINTAVSDEADIRQNADNNLQSQIDGITASSDVTDIVGTYADLQNYDTSTLSDNDIIKVLQDETHQDETTYYRWNSTTQEFTLIGEEGPYYTKSQTDVLLQDKQDTLTAGDNITIDNDNVISATDTTYSDFVGTDGTAVGTAGLVPAPATTDADKYLKSDGTWEEVGGGVTELTSADYNWPTDNPSSIAAWILDDGVYSTKSAGVRFDAYMNPVYSTSFIVTTDSSNVKYAIIFNNTEGGYIRQTGVNSTNANRILTDKNLKQATGTSTTDVMSQKATTDMVFVNNDKSRVRIGYNTSSSQPGNTAIGAGSEATGTWATGIGNYAKATGNGSVAISGVASAEGSIALGNGSIANTKGVMSIGIDSSSTFNNVKGYNDTQYRLLTGLHDPVNAHDGATKGYVDNIVVNYAGLYNAGAPTTSTVAYYLGQFYYDTTNDDIYYCSDIDTTDPNNPVYTWTALPTGGSSVNVVQATGTSTTDVMSQNAVTSMVFQDPATKLKIQIGDGAVSNPLAAYSMSIGAQSRAQGTGSIALGGGSFASSRGELNIGTPYLPGYGYNRTDYRLITGVHDGQSAQDAVTVNQVNTVIDAINTALSTSIPHIGASS